jgi:hypothetical protein
MGKLSVVLTISMSLMSFAVCAEDRVDLEGTSIIGNRELPKVLYIAPWHKPIMGDLVRPSGTLLDETLAPLDREVFARQVEYYEMNKNADAGAAHR